MAFKMNYQDQKTGAVYPESYWIPGVLLINRRNKVGQVTFSGFANQQARDESRQPISNKSYSITPQIFDEIFLTGKLNPEDKNPYLAAYELALGAKEGRPPEEGQEDLRVSFFNNAERV